MHFQTENLEVSEETVSILINVSIQPIYFWTKMLNWGKIESLNRKIFGYSIFWSIRKTEKFKNSREIASFSHALLLALKTEVY